MDPFNAKAELKTSSRKHVIYKLESLSKYGQIDRLPYSIRVLLEAVLRHVDGRVVTEEDVVRAAGYNPADVGEITASPGLHRCPGRSGLGRAQVGNESDGR